MEIIRHIADIHTGCILILIFVSCVYVMANFFSRFKHGKLTTIVIPFFFTVVYKIILDYLTTGVFVDYMDVVNVFVVIPLLFTPLFFIHGLFVGFKKIKNDAIAEVKKVKYLFFIAALAIFLTPFIYTLPESLVYWAERSFYSACVLLVFLASLLFLSPLFYALQDSQSFIKKQYKTLTKKVFFSSVYWLCLMSNILVLNFIAFVFIISALMTFVGGQR